ncbi:MAG: RIP metalloprotease RseP [Ignavibacteriaceae bacterium]
MEYIIYFAITIGILVFVHEFGHFAAAKLTGMRVDVFAIGFGKRLFGYNKITGFTFGDLPKDFDGEGNTDYRLCLLPLGGYVKIAGMVDESFDTEFANKEPQPYEFRSKSVWQKTIVITAGVIMNLLLALAVFWGVNFFQGKQIIPTTTIGYVIPNTVADSVGLQSEDKILAINGKPVNSWDEVRNEIFINTLGEDVTLKIQRGDQTSSVILPRKQIPMEDVETPLFVQDSVRPIITQILEGSPAEKAGVMPGDIFLEMNGTELFSRIQATEIITANKDKAVALTVLRNEDTVKTAVTPSIDGKIGIGISEVYLGHVDYRTYGPFESVYYGWLEIVRMTDLTFSMFGKVFAGDIEFGKAFGGPIKIAQIATTSADRGILSFLYFLALLSLSLAIINIMPFPVLDGGHLIMIWIEGAMKREIPVKIKVAIQNTGFILLLLLMAFIIYNDILNL